MARPSLKSALGREAVYDDRPEVSPGADTVPVRKAVPGRSWEDTHSRATFHLSQDLRDAIDKEAARSGRSKSQVVSDALRQHLNLQE